MQVELKSGILSLRLNTSLTLTRVDLWLGLSYCDGRWNTMTVRKESAMVSASLNELMERVSQPRAQPLAVNSPVYLGGVPPELQDSHTHLGLEPGKLHLEESPKQDSPGLIRLGWCCSVLVWFCLVLVSRCSNITEPGEKLLLPAPLLQNVKLPKK